MAKLLIHEPPLQVLPTLAVKIGLNEAIVLQQLHYWLENHKVGFEADGYKWIANSYEEWVENFPFWSASTIKRIFTALEQNGYVVSGKFEQSDWNQRKAYRIAYDLLDEVNLTQSSVSNWSPLNKNTETTTESTAKLRDLPTPRIDRTEQEQADLDEKKMVAIIGAAQEGGKADASLIAFEGVFGFGKLPWYSNSTWEKFAKFVINVHQSDPQAFGKYIVWRGEDGKYKAFSNRKIRENPQAFMDTGWPEFENRPQEQYNNGRSANHL